MKISFWGFALAALSALSLSVPASGAVITQYSDRASWEAATSGRVDIDFSRADGTSSYLYAPGQNFSSPAVNFTGFYNEGFGNNFFLGWSDASASHNAAWQFTMGGNSTGGLLAGGAQSSVQNGFNSGIIVNMGSNTGINMLAFDFAALRYLQSNNSTLYPLTGALQLVVYENNVATTTVNLSNNTAQILNFIGIRTDGEISGVRLLTSNSTGPNTILATAIMDNFSFGNFTVAPGSGGGGGGELPEPATFLTAAAACLLFSISRYWKR
jgi:hypothetical protein